MKINEEGNCQHFESKYVNLFYRQLEESQVIEITEDEKKNILRLIKYSQEYIDSGLIKYETCYFNKEDLELIIKALKRVVNNNEDK